MVVIFISDGFAELDAEGRHLEDEIRGIARGKMRIVGPNCLGIIHPLSNLNASLAASMVARERCPASRNVGRLKG